MNAILQKRIDEAARESVVEEIPPYMTSDFVNDSEVECAYERAQETFIAGANFALQNQWISVSETLPQKDDLYFVLINSTHPRVTEFEQGKWQGYDNITHWMQIPELKGGEK